MNIHNVEFIKSAASISGFLADGLPEIVKGNTALARFANLCGQLRFQIRWTQAPRIPATSVLGHMFIVAAYAYFFSQSIGACRARAVNDFFCGLLHDLPELLTRDIISPVKQSVESLPEIIREYEEQELERRIEQGDACAGKLYWLMAYQLAGSIACLSAACKGKVDRIILTGGLAHSKLFTGWVSERVSFLAPVVIVPGEQEMQALAEGALRVLRGEEEAQLYRWLPEGCHSIRELAAKGAG